MNLLLDLCKRLRCLHRRNRTANNLASCPFQFQNLGHRRLHILCAGIRHRLDGNRASSAYTHISYPNLFRLVSKHCFILSIIQYPANSRNPSIGHLV